MLSPSGYTAQQWRGGFTGRPTNEGPRRRCRGAPPTLR